MGSWTWLGRFARLGRCVAVALAMMPGGGAWAQSDLSSYTLYAVDGDSNSLVLQNFADGETGTIADIRLASDGRPVQGIQAIAYVPGHTNLMAFWSDPADGKTKLVYVNMKTGAATIVGDDLGDTVITGAVAVTPTAGDMLDSGEKTPVEQTRQHTVYALRRDNILSVVVLDSDAIDPGFSTVSAAAAEHGVSAEYLVNDDAPTQSANPVMRWSDLHAGDEVWLPAGQAGDEGWYALPLTTPWTLDDLVAGNVPQSQLDEIEGVRALRNPDLEGLVGRQLVAVVHDSDVSMNYHPTRANLQGNRYGRLYMTVLEVRDAGTLPESQSSSSLNEVKVRIENPPAGSPTLVSSQYDPGAVNFTIEDGEVVASEEFRLQVKVLGAAITSGGTPMPVTMSALIGSEAVEPFGPLNKALSGNVNDGANPRAYVSPDAHAAGTAVTITGRSWKKNSGDGTLDSHYTTHLSFNSTTNQPQVKVLRDGDPVPEIEPLGDQAAVAEYLGDFIDHQTDTMRLGVNDVIYLFELGTTDIGASAADFQDLVVLVTLEKSEPAMAFDAGAHNALITVDHRTGQTTEVMALSRTYDSLAAYSAEKFYATLGEQIYLIDPAAGTETLIGVMSVGMPSFEAAGPTIYGVGAADDDLYPVLSGEAPAAAPSVDLAASDVRSIVFIRNADIPRMTGYD